MTISRAHQAILPPSTCHDGDCEMWKPTFFLRRARCVYELRLGTSAVESVVESISECRHGAPPLSVRRIFSFCFRTWRSRRTRLQSLRRTVAPQSWTTWRPKRQHLSERRKGSFVACVVGLSMAELQLRSRAFKSGVTSYKTVCLQVRC